MNDSQITDLLRALGAGLLAVNLIGAAAAVPGAPHYAGVSVALVLASFAFDVTRRLRTRRALKRLKRELGDKATRPSIILGGDQ